MKTTYTLCLAAALVGAASGQGSATDFFTQVAFSGADGEEGSGGTADQLVQALEADEQVTGELPTNSKKTGIPVFLGFFLRTLKLMLPICLSDDKCNNNEPMTRVNSSSPPRHASQNL